MFSVAAVAATVGGASAVGGGAADGVGDVDRGAVETVAPEWTGAGCVEPPDTTITAITSATRPMTPMQPAATAATFR